VERRSWRDLATSIDGMGMPHDPDWYFDHVLTYADPDGPIAVTGPAGRWQRWWRHRRLDLSDTDFGRFAAAQGFVLTVQQAASFGLTPNDIRREIRRGRWMKVMWGVIAPLTIASTGNPSTAARRRHALMAAGAALVRPDEVVSGTSGAIMHGLPTMHVPTRPQLTTRRPDTLGRRSGAHVYGATVRRRHTTIWFGAPVTTVARTVVDQARHDRRDGLLAAEASRFEGLITIAELRGAVRSARGWPGVRSAREMIALCSDRSESALESLTRLNLYDSGLPMPDQQIEIGPYRVDFLWPEQRLILEVDGRAKSSTEELWREKRRDIRLRRLGYRVVRVTWDDVVNNWPDVARYLRTKLSLPR
jgi:very-short-patch-repair endonuclease